MTTPIKIDINGIQIDDGNNSKNISLTPNDGLKIEFDLGTANPKTFKINNNGVNYTDNTNNNTTGLDRLALVQQAFQAVELPPNSTTLKINKTLEINNGTDNGQLTINASGNTEIVCSKNFELNELAIFNIVPTCPTLPTAGIQLTNKSYVDGKFCLNTTLTYDSPTPTGLTLNTWTPILDYGTLQAGTYLFTVSGYFNYTTVNSSVVGLRLWNNTTSSQVGTQSIEGISSGFNYAMPGFGLIRVLTTGSYYLQAYSGSDNAASIMFSASYLRIK